MEITQKIFLRLYQKEEEIKKKIKNMNSSMIDREKWILSTKP